MKPISDTILQNQVSPARPHPQAGRDAPPGPVTPAPGRNTFALPEDIVNISSDRLAHLISSANKKPSVPVSAGEKQALRESFSVYA